MQTTEKYNEMMYIASELVKAGIKHPDDILDLTIKDYNMVMQEYQKIVFGLLNYKTDKYGSYNITLN